jgi:metalloendopeptidase OMA1, mitochondrial
MENDRLDMQHYIFKVLFGNRDYFAPLDRNTVKRIMDIGTGTGKWAIEMGT